MHIKKIIGAAKLTFSAVMLLQQIGFAQENNGNNSAALAVQSLNQNSIYLGVDNPVRIVCEKPYNNVSVTSGKIIPTASPFDYIIRASTAEPCTLLVKNNETVLASTVLRVKRLPMPKLFLGSISGPATISKAVLTASGTLSAKIENLDDRIATFNVVSWEVVGNIDNVIFSFVGNGSQLSNEVLEKLKTADIEDRIFIDAKVQGPDRVITALPTLSIKIN